MPTFEYKAMTKQGRMITNKIDFDGSMSTLRNSLAAEGLKVVSIKEKKFDIEKLFGTKQKSKMNKRAAIGLNEAVLTQDKFLQIM